MLNIRKENFQISRFVGGGAGRGDGGRRVGASSGTRVYAKSRRSVLINYNIITRSVVSRPFRAPLGPCLLDGARTRPTSCTGDKA